MPVALSAFMTLFIMLSFGIMLSCIISMSLASTCRACPISSYHIAL